MSERPTDEELTEWDSTDWDDSYENPSGGVIERLTQEVRRLREGPDNSQLKVWLINAEDSTSGLTKSEANRRTAALIRRVWELEAAREEWESVGKAMFELAEEAERRLEEATVALGSFTESLAKAEAEVERLREVVQGHLDLRRTLSRTRADLRAIEAERNRYKGALEEIASYGPELDNTPPTPPQVALAALSQPVREEGEEE